MFLKTVKKTSQCSNIHANSNDGITGEKIISTFWRDHHQTILNSNECNYETKMYILSFWYSVY